MPYRSKKKRREYMKEYRKDKKQVLIDEKTIEELKKQWPGAYELIFGRTQRRTSSNTRRRTDDRER